MKHSLLIKTAKENHFHLEQILKMLLGNSILIEEKEGLLHILHTFEDEQQILQAIQSLEDDLNTTISTFQSIYDIKLIELIIPTFKGSRYGHYQFKSLLEHAKDIEKSNDLLDLILEGSGVDRSVLEAMANSDLNVSQAASELYMHRNTLLYKIERLKELRQFDLKKFNDLYILMKLMKA